MGVYLLEREGRKERNSLYLVIYSKGKRSHKFLKLYVYKNPATPEQREHNRYTRKLAKKLKAQAELDLQFNEHHEVSPIKEKMSLLKYFEKVKKEKDNSDGWNSAYLHLKNFTKETDVALSLIDNIWLNNYQKYLLTSPIGRGGKSLARNSASCYYTKLAVVLKQAYMERYIKENPCSTTKTIKPIATHRSFVSIEEIKNLKATPCEDQELKLAFLFACYTGLRISDLLSLTWEQFSYSDAAGWSLTYTKKRQRALKSYQLQ